MDHFRNEWQEYKNGCDSCLEEFLQTIDEEEIAEAERLLSADFTEKVMKLVVKEKKSKAAINPFAEKKKNTIIYYVAAASITLLFVGSGLFQTFIQGFTKPAALEISTKIINNQKSYDISGKIVNKASLWIENFESQRRYFDETKE